eukprot:gene5557-45118_t
MPPFAQHCPYITADPVAARAAEVTERRLRDLPAGPHRRRGHGAVTALVFWQLHRGRVHDDITVVVAHVGPNGVRGRALDATKAERGEARRGLSTQQQQQGWAAARFAGVRPDPPPAVPDCGGGSQLLQPASPVRSDSSTSDQAASPAKKPMTHTDQPQGDIDLKDTVVKDDPKNANAWSISGPNLPK